MTESSRLENPITIAAKAVSEALGPSAVYGPLGSSADLVAVEVAHNLRDHLSDRRFWRYGSPREIIGHSLRKWGLVDSHGQVAADASRDEVAYRAVEALAIAGIFTHHARQSFAVIRDLEV